jgi:putative transposase
MLHVRRLAPRRDGPLDFLRSWRGFPTRASENYAHFKPLFIVSFYRRRLPHWQPDRVPIFVTWRLYGSLPTSVSRYPATPARTEGQRFLAGDREMDRTCSGPMWLKDPRVAACVVGTLLVAEKKWELCDLFAWAVMSNHVHLLFTPHGLLKDVTRAVKKTSARQANLILARTGQPFWQEESYDHWVRDGKEFDRIVGYIEWNPVRAGLVECAEEWPWSSASPRFG